MTPWPAGAAVLALLAAAALGPALGRRRASAAIAVLGAAVAAALAVLLALRAGPGVVEVSTPFTPTGAVPIVLGVRVDPLAASIGVMVTLVALAVQVYSVGLMGRRPRYASYSALISLFTAGMLIVVFSADLMVTYVGWEVMGVCSYLLIGHHWEDRPTTAAALKAFLMTRVGDVGFLLGIIVLGLAAGSFRITAVLDAVPGMSGTTLLAASLLLLLGVVAKSGQFPLHSWLPDAMAGPAPVSALIHAATMVAAGVYLVARLHPVFQASPASLAVLAVVAVITMLGAALAALAAEDLKRVLAYSTISQLGLMFGALAVGGVPEGVAHLLSHAAFKALLFLAAGAVAVAVGTTALSGMGGLRRGMPITAAAATVGFAALAGLPPTSGFVSKDGMLEAAWHAAGTPVGALVLGGALSTTAVTGAYATRAWLRVFGGRPRSAREVPASLAAPMVALAVPALGLGAWWVLSGALPVDVPIGLVSTALALAGAGAGYTSWRRAPGRPMPRVLVSAFGTDDLYERTVVPMVQRLATRVVGVDDGVVGAAVRGTGRGAQRLGAVLRSTQTGNPQFYVTGVLAGVLVLTLAVGVLR